jgi:hypothetical protein
MGNDLYHTIPKFFEDRMAEHSMVTKCERLSVDGEFVYELTRVRFNDRVRVWLSDAYHFSETDFYSRPKELRAGDYILIAKPEGGGGVGTDVVIAAKIGVGKMRELMGALSVKHMWTYTPPTDVELEQRKKRRGLFRSSQK